MLANESLAGNLPGHSPIPLHPLFAGAEQVPLDANELLYMLEEESGHVYLVVEGEIRQYKINAEGREFTLGVYGAGEIVGESELLTGCRRACYAAARGPALVLALDRRAFLDHLRGSPGETLELVRFLSLKNQMIERKMESILFKSAHAKVAEQLLALAEQHSKPAPGSAGKSAVSIDYPITHQEIANLVGATRETVSYVLLDFKAAELIETGRRRIGIRDLAGLQELARA